MVGGIFQGSNDINFTTSTTLYTITTAPAVGVYTTVSVASPAKYQYVRYLAPNGSYGDIAEVQFYGIAQPAVTVNSGVLTVTGTTGADKISVVVAMLQANEENPTQAIVNYGTYTITVNGLTQTFGANGITALLINSLDGNDIVSVSGDENIQSGTVGFPAEEPINVSLVSGNGNDSLTTYITANDGNNMAPVMSAVAGDGNDTVDLGGTEVQTTLGNGNDTISTDDTGQELFATIVAGNGNDTYADTNAFQLVTITAGTGADVFDNTDPDSTEAVNIIGGESFAVQYGTGVITGKAYIDSNGDGLYETGEPLLSGATVNVSTVYSSPAQTLAGTTTTDGSGNYIYAVSNGNDSPNSTSTAMVVAPVGIHGRGGLDLVCLLQPGR